MMSSATPMSGETAMTTFEVTIESAAQRPLRLLIAADNWVDAWREGLRVIGVDELPADAQCVVTGERVAIAIPSLERTIHLTPRPDEAPAPTRTARLVAADHAERPPAPAHQPTQNPKLFRRPPHAGAPPHAPPAPAPTPTTSVTPDPIARVLSDLERQRLLSRPVRISSKDGLPTTEPRRVGAQSARAPTPTGVPRLQPSTDERKRPREHTRAFSTAPTDQLPQLFHPVQADDDDGDALDPILRWAADTAWQHVPCALALVLDCESEGECHVAMARGEREREARGCRLTPDPHGPLQLGRSPSLRRLPEARTLAFERPDGTAWTLPVTSLLSAPVVHPDGELSGLTLVLVDAARPTGFTDSELRALAYLAKTLAQRL